MLSISINNIFFKIAFCLVCLIIFPTPLVCANFEILISVKDIDNQPIAANTITVELAGGVYEDFEDKNGYYLLKKQTSTDKIDSFEISVNFGKPYLNRNIRIADSPDKIEKPIKLFKAPDDDYYYNYLQKGLRYVNIRPYDKALAYYEAASKKYPLMPLDQHSACLYYNYAIALANTYKFNNYDNYDLSISYLENLKDLYDNEKNKIYLDPEVKSKEKLEKDIEDIKNYKQKVERTNFLNDYQKVQEEFRNGNYLESAKLAERLLKVCEDNKKLCKSTPLNEDRFLTDVGVSYLKAAEQAERENKPKTEIIGYFINAKDALEKVERLDLDTVRKNLRNINSKLIVYQ